MDGQDRRCQGEDERQQPHRDPDRPPGAAAASGHGSCPEVRAVHPAEALGSDPRTVFRHGPNEPPHSARQLPVAQATLQKLEIGPPRPAALLAKDRMSTGSNLPFQPTPVSRHYREMSTGLTVSLQKCSGLVLSAGDRGQRSGRGPYRRDDHGGGPGGPSRGGRTWLCGGEGKRHPFGEMDWPGDGAGHCPDVRAMARAVGCDPSLVAAITMAWTPPPTPTRPGNPPPCRGDGSRLLDRGRGSGRPEPGSHPGPRDQPGSMH